jgi:hypothetical protein
MELGQQKETEKKGTMLQARISQHEEDYLEDAR